MKRMRKTRKIMGIMATAVCCALFCVACGNENDPNVENPSEVIENVESHEHTHEYKSVITLANYDGMTIDYSMLEFSEEEYQMHLEQIEHSLGDYESILEGTVQQGDFVGITYNGWLEENTAEAGATQEYNPSMSTSEVQELEIGSNTYIPGFESSLVGKTIGETTQIITAFPEDYGSEEFNGKTAIFEVTIHEVRVYSEEPSDEIVLANLVPQYYQNVEDAEFKTWSEFKEWLKADMIDYYDVVNTQTIKNMALEQIMENSTIEYNEEDIAHAIEDAKLQYEQEATYYEMDTETLATNYGYAATGDKTAYDLLLEDAAKESIKYNVTMEAIVKAENIILNEGDTDAYITYLSGIYMVSEEEIRSAYIVVNEDGSVTEYTHALETETLYWKAMERLIEKCNVIDTTAEMLETPEETIENEENVDDTEVSSAN